MEIAGKTVLILGGYGLVGYEVAKKILKESPSHVILLSLKKEETERAIEDIKKECPDSAIQFSGEYGNIFSSEELKDLPPAAIKSHSDRRKRCISDIFDELTDEKLNQYFLYQVITWYSPDIIIDAVNTATAISYQNIFDVIQTMRATVEEAKDLQKNPPSLEKGASSEDLKIYIEKLQQNSNKLIDISEICISSMYVPQLLRHLQVLYHAFKKGNVKKYIKIGTSGTGGMGFNIPYTHGEEEHPSKLVMSKAALAGSHTLLLFLMARTPGAPIIKEIKPTAGIGWREIRYDQIKKGNRTVWLYRGVREPLGDSLNLRYTSEDGQWSQFGKGEAQIMKSVYVDVGESGLYSLGEFEVLTSLNQMEYVTTEEVADNILFEIKGINTGHDIVNALDSASMGPSYRAGFLRSYAIGHMKTLEKKHHCSSVAFEMLGPPRVSKLLFECHLFKLAFGEIPSILNLSPSELSQKIEAFLLKEEDLVSEIVSIGLPILLGNGKELLRGPEIKIPFKNADRKIILSNQDVDLWSKEGWVDLRESNMAKWKKRFQSISEDLGLLSNQESSGSGPKGHLVEAEQGYIEIGEVVGWILNNEEKGYRIKE